MITAFPIANMTAFTVAYAQSDLFGRMILIGLIVLSMISWAFLLRRIWQARKIKELSTSFENLFKNHTEELFKIDVEAVLHNTQAQLPHPYAQIFHELKTKTTDILNKNLYFAKAKGLDPSPGIYLSQSDLEIVEAHVLTEISSQRKFLEKNLFILSTITTLGPFLGLLGTVWGILVTFADLHSGGSIGSSAAVLGGISTALATTVLGLIIAIPALIAYNYLRNVTTTYGSEMEDFFYRLLSAVELQYRKVDTS